MIHLSDTTVLRDRFQARRCPSESLVLNSYVKKEFGEDASAYLAEVLCEKSLMSSDEN